MKFIGENIGQLFRYALVGLSINAMMYFVYLILTEFYFSPFSSVLLLYPLGVLVGFFSHRGLTFKLSSQKWGFLELSKYVLLSVMGFFLNLLLLYVFFERLGYPHQLVQLAAIFIVAGFQFISMKLFVFPAMQNKELTIE